MTAFRNKDVTPPSCPTYTLVSAAHLSPECFSSFSWLWGEEQRRPAGEERILSNIAHRPIVAGFYRPTQPSPAIPLPAVQGR